MYLSEFLPEHPLSSRRAAHSSSDSRYGSLQPSFQRCSGPAFPAHTLLPCPPGRLPSPGRFSQSLGGLAVLAVLARAGCVFLCCPRSWPHSAHLVLGLGQPLASLYSLKPPSELRFVFNSQLISRSKKIEIEESKRPSGGPVLILHEVSPWAGC